MSIAVEENAPRLQQRRARDELWLDDLRWHKHMFQQSRFQWTGEHVMAVVTRITGGQLDFSTVRHLRLLQRDQDQLRDYSAQCQSAMGEPLEEAGVCVGGGGWHHVARAVGLEPAECTLTVAMARRTPPAERTNADVRRVMRALPFCNPLIQVWELKQLWRLYEATRDIVEDTICDLLLELLPTCPVEELTQALGPLSMKPAERARWSRLERGGPGDPRRVPQQVF